MADAGRSLRGSADRNLQDAAAAPDGYGRSLRGSADRNEYRSHCMWKKDRRSLRGSADRNYAPLLATITIPRALPRLKCSPVLTRCLI